MKRNAFQFMQAVLANHARNAQFMKIFDFQIIKYKVLIWDF